MRRAAVAVPASAGGRRRYDVSSLLDIAAALFTERGYDITSMEDLSRATGLSKSSLYHHIDGKEQLLRLALERAVGPLFAVLEEPDSRQGPAIDRLAHVVRREVEVLANSLPYVTLLLRVRGNSETERWALARRREFDHAVAELVARAAADGELRDDLDPHLVTRLLFGMINSLVDWYRPGGHAEVNGRDHARGLRPDDVADAILEVVFGGLQQRR